MTEPEQAIVVGVFSDRRAVVRTINALIEAGFHEEQMGFASRDQQPPNQTPRGYDAIKRGVIGGILGAADMLLVPVTGPTDAVNILNMTLPVTEEAIDDLPYPGSSNRAEVVRPDAPMTTPEHTHEKPESVQITHKALPGSQAQEHTGLITGGVVGGVIGAAAALLIPGIGPAVAGGVLAAVLGGGAIGGVAGGFLGAFTSMGVPHEKAREYEQHIKTGQTILTVKTTDRKAELVQILREHGAHNVETH